jgi:hypothetical protein
MKRILIASVLAAALLLTTADNAHALGCCGFGPGYFSVGLNFNVAWGRGGCGCGGPAVYSAPPPPLAYAPPAYGYPAPAYGYGYPAPGYGGGYYAGGYGPVAGDYGQGGGAQGTSPVSYGGYDGYGQGGYGQGGYGY